MIHDASDSPVTYDNPARPGEILNFYFTGLGAVEPRPPSPLVEPFPCSLISRIGPEIKLPEVFAGLAPGLTGLYLVSVRLPDTLANGDYSLSCAQTPVGGAKLIVAHGYQ